MADYTKFTNEQLIKIIEMKNSDIDQLEEDIEDLEEKVVSKGVDAFRDTTLESLQWVLTYLYKGDTQSAIIHVDRIIEDLRAK